MHKIDFVSKRTVEALIFFLRKHLVEIKDSIRIQKVNITEDLDFVDKQRSKAKPSAEFRTGLQSVKSYQKRTLTIEPPHCAT